MSTKIKILHPRYALVLLFSLMALFLIFVSLAGELLGRVIERPQAAIRVTIVLQDLLVFILPAVITAVLVTRTPGRLLGVDRAPKLPETVVSLGILLCSMPAMNVIIQWNESITLPAWLAGVETILRQLEDSAQATTDLLMKGASVWSMIVSVLIVGVLAAVSEELFFRGALQGILCAKGLKPHLAIWLAAFIFSLLHFQFYGFVPRLLLGAMFGYMLWSTGSLWVPMVVHAINNSLVVLTTWWQTNHPGTKLGADTFGTDWSNAIEPVAAVLSIALTALLFVGLKKLANRPKYVA